MTQSSMSIQDAEIIVYLGWLEEERQRPQTVLLDLSIWFEKTPAACQTDTLEDTVCYKTLLESIRSEMVKKEFKLVEHLTYELFHYVKRIIPEAHKINVHVTKFPQVSGLKGGVCFSYAGETA